MHTSPVTDLLLKWFAQYGRDLAWRHRGGAHPNPYHVLVSEIMLQQTTVATVGPYFHRFIARFPDVASLAAADIADVYHLWQGLGYYSRARSLHKTATILANEFGGVFPDDRDAWLKMPGIGPYTAASILSLGFNRAETVVDGNVVRVICRLFGLDAPVDSIRNQIRTHATELTSPHHPADYASAIMDFGATVCTPRTPQCDQCPIAAYCVAHKTDRVAQIPVITKLARPERHGAAYLIKNSRGQFFIRRRTGRGLLAGLYELPWTDDGAPVFHTPAIDTGVTVTHTFTHFKLFLNVRLIEMDDVPIDGTFVDAAMLDGYPMSTLMKKAAAALMKKSLI